jgi:CRP-like cAMP-binding protein
MLSLLSESDTFEGCTDQELNDIAAAAEKIEFEAGETIFEAGSPADYLYVVGSGKIRLQFRVTNYGAPQDITIDRKIQGDVLGWSAATKPLSFSLSAVAESDCSLLRILGSDLKRMCAENDHFGHVFMENMADIIGQRLNILRRMLIDIVQDRMATA